LEINRKENAQVQKPICFWDALNNKRT
jgi:hypothetical protein